MAPNRARWGCDAPLEVGAAWKVACGCGGDPECPRNCHEGWIALRRCPNATLREAHADERAELQRFFSSYGPYVRDGVLPCAGGYLDQTAAFVEGTEIAESEKRAWDAEDDQRRRSKQARKGGKRG
jgi:hypothetical protein